MPRDFNKETKWCGRCEKHHPIAEFEANPTRPDGLQHWCKASETPGEKSQTKCTIDGCTAPAWSRQMCGGHYARWKQFGDPRQVSLRKTRTEPVRKDHGPFPDTKSEICTAKEGCTRNAVTRNLCSKHYKRFLEHGDDSFLKVRKKDGVNCYGYREVYSPYHPNADKKGMLGEHRLVVAEFLKRPLVDEENVHHRDGNRINNTVGPCVLKNFCDCENERHNLEIWSKAQPIGQRVEDKLAWAEEIFKLYAPDKLMKS